MYYERDLLEALPASKPVEPTKPVTPPLGPEQQTLLEAAEWLRSHMWIQNALRRNVPEPASCLVGALGRIEQDRNIKRRSRRLVEKHLGCDATMWNDHYSRTKGEVLNLLETVGLKGK